MAVEKETDRKLEQLKELQQRSQMGGGPSRVEQQHAKGKLTARERVTILLDQGTFSEIDPFVTHRATEFGMADKVFLGDAVVTGYGKVDGRQTFVFAQDFTVLGGSVSEVVGQKICKVMDLAMKAGSPVIGLNDSGGARIPGGSAVPFRLRRNLPEEHVGIRSRASDICYRGARCRWGGLFASHHRLHLHGPGRGTDVHHGARCHQGCHRRGSHPRGPRRSAGRMVAGAVLLISCTTQRMSASAQVRRLLGFLPSNNMDDSPLVQTPDDPQRLDESLASIVPDEPSRAYDIRDVVLPVVDDDEFMEVHQDFAPNIVVGFARLNGKTVGIVGNQPAYLAGVLDINASVKAARFVRFCDCFNIPIVTFVDVPGFMPGSDQEYGGIIRHGAKLLYAYSEATVPKISVMTRKAYGGAYIVMGSKHLRGDINLAWPSAEIAVMGPEGAVNHHFPRGTDQVRPRGSEARGPRPGVPRQVRQPIRGRQPRLS